MIILTTNKWPEIGRTHKTVWHLLRAIAEETGGDIPRLFLTRVGWADEDGAVALDLERMNKSETDQLIARYKLEEEIIRMGIRCAATVAAMGKGE